jgi:hypothetical protein
MRSIFMYYVAAALGAALLASEASAQLPGNQQPRPKVDPARPRPNPNPINIDRARINNDRPIIRDRGALERARLNNGLLREEVRAMEFNAFNSMTSWYPTTPYAYPSYTANMWMANRWINPWLTNAWMPNAWMPNPLLPYSNIYAPFGPWGGFNSINYWGMGGMGMGMGGMGMGMGGMGLPASGFGSGFGTY